MQQPTAAVTAPVLNDQAVGNLDSTEPETVRDALQYLTSYGRKEDPGSALVCYIEWTNEYEGTAVPLDKSGPLDWDKNFANSTIGEELGRALIQNQGWFADPELISRVLKRCVGELHVQEPQAYHADWEVAPYRLDLPKLSMSNGVVNEFIGVAQYGTRSLKLFEAKISQFPPGIAVCF